MESSHLTDLSLMSFYIQRKLLSAYIKWIQPQHPQTCIFFCIKEGNTILLEKQKTLAAPTVAYHDWFKKLLKIEKKFKFL